MVEKQLFDILKEAYQHRWNITFLELSRLSTPLEHEGVPGSILRPFKRSKYSRRGLTIPEFWKFSFYQTIEKQSFDVSTDTHQHRWNITINGKMLKINVR